MNNPSITKQDPFEQDSMTLRDYFAAKAMQALITANPQQIHNIDQGSALSYNWADAMLIERQKEKTNERPNTIK